MPDPILHEVISVRATLEQGAFIVRVDITDFVGVRETLDYLTRPSDPYGLNPTIQQWLSDHAGEYEILPYEPPAPEPPTPYTLQMSDFWSRFEDDTEYEFFDAALVVALPAKDRRAFNAATSLRSDSTLFGWGKAVLLNVVGPTRTAVIMAPSPTYDRPSGD